MKALALWYDQIDDEVLISDVSSDGHSSETNSDHEHKPLELTNDSVI
jgi:hypothetical protein